MFSFKKKEEKVKVDQNTLVSANKTAALFDSLAQIKIGNSKTDKIIANLQSNLSKATLSAAENKQKAEIKKLAEQNPKIALSEELARSIRDYSDESRLKQAFNTFISKGGDVNIPCKSGPLLNFAISVSNMVAFDLLLAYGADIHKSTSEIAAPIVAAAGLNNEEMLNKLLKKGAHPDEFSSANALGYCITSIHSYSLIEHAAWNQSSPLVKGNDDKLSKKLKSWFYQSDEYITKDPAKPVPFFTSKNPQPLQGLYCGNLNLVAYLLNAGTRTSTTNIHGVSPRMIVETPEEHLDSFTSSDKEQLKFIDNKSGLLSFRITIWNRSESDSINVEFVYSLKNIQNLFFKFRQENPNTYYTDEELVRMQSTFERRNNDLINDRLQQESKENNERFENIETRLSTIEEQVKQNTQALNEIEETIVDSLQNSAIKLRWKSLISKINCIENPKEKALKQEFTIAMNARLRSSISAFVTLHSNFQQRASNTRADHIRGFIQGVLELIPVFGQYSSKLGDMATKLIDLKEEEIHKKIAYLFVTGADQDELSLCLAISATTHAWQIITPSIFTTKRDAESLHGIIYNKIRSVFENTAEDFGDKVATTAWLFLTGLKTQKTIPSIQQLHDYLIKQVTETSIFTSHEIKLQKQKPTIEYLPQGKPLVYSPVYTGNTQTSVQTSIPGKKMTGNSKLAYQF